MPNLLKIFLLILILVQLLLIIRTINLKRLSIRYGSFWILLLLLMIIPVIFPEIFEIISNFFKFEATSNMVFIIGFFFLFSLNFILITNISIQNEKIKLLIQELSILKERIDKNEKRK